ncbi:dipeptidase [Steroidobacter sp.]|uniref:dipeptidase n=1 Tax=Steroidobacter sp. TaxID=1978227 RepID=UPI001A551169|nr:membrane dipeptidase [Steroidobacter sp.]MBL8269664.1 membrane dipeptidase [Steroidobacter sp.]
MIDRRAFLQAAAAAGLGVTSVSRALSASGFSSKRYAAAIVIDALGSPLNHDSNSAGGLLSKQALSDVRASGVTAINVTVGAVGNGPGLYEDTIQGIADYDAEIARHGDRLLKVLTAGDIQTAKSSGRLGLIFGFQDSSVLGGEVTRLSQFHGLGVRVVQLTYNRRNLVGDGCLEPGDGGLSVFGREVVAEINRLGLLLDLSHASARTIADGIAAANRPMTISHTGCRALVDVPRNTHDRELKALADKGGVAGIYFMPFLRASGQPRSEDLIRHLEHAVNVCGEDHVGLGTDGTISGTKLDAAFAQVQREFYEKRRKLGIAAPGEAADVFNLIPDYNDPRRFVTLADDLSRRGWSEARIEKILGANFARLFKDVWGG